MTAAPRVTVVVLTHDRPTELRRVLERLLALPERPPVVVVDNASAPGVVERVLAPFPEVERVRCPANLGAAGRNAGVARARTPYVAFCDDDTWWAPGALRRAADLLDAWPDVAVVAARVLVGPREREDPACLAMARSPLDSRGLPGPALASFMAGACVMRTAAYRAAGGYEPRLFLGAEELLLALDIAARGGRIVHMRDVVTHHHPSGTGRDPTGRRIAVARNKLWIGCMRLPWRVALPLAMRTLAEARAQGVLGRAVAAAIPGLPWALWRRRRVPAAVAEAVAAVFLGRGAGPAAELSARRRVEPGRSRACAASRRAGGGGAPAGCPAPPASTAAARARAPR